MNKQEIFKKLDELELDKDKYIVISGASLVVQDILDETSDIDLSCSETYYEKINSFDDVFGAKRNGFCANGSGFPASDI